MTEQTPREVDEKLAELSELAERQDREIVWAWDRIHRAAGDRQEYITRTRKVWRLRDSEVLKAAEIQRDRHGDARDLTVRMRPSELIAKIDEAQAARTATLEQIQELDAIYRAAPWSRFFPCETHDGHIHSSLGCHTLRPTSVMRWTPSLSGKSVDEAVAELGPALCQVCFPEAKAEYKRQTLGQVKRDRDRARIDAEKAERDAKKAAKTLTENQQFRTRYMNDRITTVAACKDVIRKAIEEKVQLETISTAEFASTYPGDIKRFRANIASNLAQMEADAETAAAVLIEREKEHEGWGMTRKHIVLMRDRKLRQARREWGQY